MPKISSSFSSFSVDDLDAEQSFLLETLELTVERSEMGILQLDVEGTRVAIYPKPDHTPAAFTVLNFVVPDIDVAVDELVAKGVTFERYEGFNMDEHNIARGNGPSIAWFKDPAGNIFSVLQD